MHNFTSDVFKWASTIKIHPRAAVMNEGMSYRDQNHVLYQAVNEFTGHFNVGHYRDWLASAASLKWPFEELQFWHICFGFILQHQMFGITKNLFWCAVTVLTTVSQCHLWRKESSDLKLCWSLRNWRMILHHFFSNRSPPSCNQWEALTEDETLLTWMELINMQN